MLRICILGALLALSPVVKAGDFDKRLFAISVSTASSMTHHGHVLGAAVARSERRQAALGRRFKLGKVYAYPNPAVGVKHPVIHVEAGLADKAEVKIYGPDGALLETTLLTSPPEQKNGVYSYEYRFASENTPQGTCSYTVELFKKGAAPLKTSGKIFFIRTYTGGPN
jgi:hypothetical protein